MPSRQELCIKNLFSVADCKMHWQKNGDYLCVKVDRYSKAKKIEEKDQFKYSVSIRSFLVSVLSPQNNQKSYTTTLYLGF